MAWLANMAGASTAAVAPCLRFPSNRSFACRAGRTGCCIALLGVACPYGGGNNDTGGHDASYSRPYRQVPDGEPRTATAYAALVLAALLRPLAEVVPEHYLHLLSVSAVCWIVAFTLFVVEYGPFLGLAEANFRTETGVILNSDWRRAIEDGR